MKKFGPFRFLLCLPFLLLPVTILKATPDPIPSFFRYQILNTTNGLSQNSVYNIFQDQAGFIWIATQDGLNRFDGFEFKIYRGSFYNLQLPPNHIRKIIEPVPGVLWLGTYGGGIYQLDTISDSLSPLPIYLDPGQTPGNSILNLLYSDSDDKVYIHSIESGLLVYHLKTNTWQPLFKGTTPPPNWPETSPSFIHLLGQDSLLVAFDNREIGILTLNDQNYMPLRSTVPFAPLDPSSFENTHRHHGWLGSKSGLWKVDLQNKTLTPVEIKNGTILNQVRISDLTLDPSGNLYISTIGNGLFYIDPNTESLLFNSDIGANEFGLPSRDLRSLLVDDFQNLWIGTYTAGLARINFSAQKFEHIKDHGNSNNTVVSIWTDPESGELYAGTFGGGILYFNPETLTLDRFVPGTKPVSNLGQNEILHLIPWSAFELLAGTHNGLYLFNRQTKTFRKLESVVPNLPSFFNQRIRQTSWGPDGYLYVASFGKGIYVIDRTKGLVKLISTDPQSEPVISSNEVVSIFFDSNQMLWAGTYGSGLERIDLKAKTVRHYKSNSQNESSLANDFILRIKEDHLGFLWIATRGGLHQFNSQTGTFARITETDGLSNNIVYDILIDSTNGIWASTNQGLSFLRTINNKPRVMKIFHSEDGLQSEEFNVGASAIDRNQMFYFGGVNGINRFNPYEFTDSHSYPKTVITNLLLNGQPVYLANNDSTLNIAEGKHEIQVSFSALEFINPEKNEFWYFIENYEDDWIFHGNNRMVTINNLPAGNYRFWVQATNHDGVRNGSIAGFYINIPIPLWNRWYAWILYLALLSAGIVGFITVRQRTLEDKNKQLQLMVAEKTKALQAQTKELENSYTKLRLSQSFLIQSEKMASLGTLVAGVAHEINNPVNFITSSIDPLKADIQELVQVIQAYRQIVKTIKSEYAGKAGAFEKLFADIEIMEQNMDIDQLLGEIDILFKGIENGTSRTSDIVSSLRTFSRSDEQVLQEADIHQILKSTLNILKKEIERYNIELVENYQDIQGVKCFPGQLSQVFMNIIMNAIQALSGIKDGRIEISTQDIGGQVVIMIQDNGPGIPEEIHSRIFDPFFTTKPIGEGTGMGLSITYKIIENHQGNIQVISEPGKGTGFVITLPRGV